MARPSEPRGAGLPSGAPGFAARIDVERPHGAALLPKRPLYEPFALREGGGDGDAAPIAALTRPSLCSGAYPQSPLGSERPDRSTVMVRPPTRGAFSKGYGITNSSTLISS